MKPADFKGTSPDVFRAKREALGWSQPKAGRFLGCSRGTIANYEAGETEIPPTTAASLMRAVPVLGRIKAGVPDLAVQKADDWVEWTKPNRGDVYALHVVGNSMRSRGVMPGDLVFIRADEPDVGDIVVAMIGEEATLKRLKERDGERYLDGDDGEVPITKGDPVWLMGKAVDLWRGPGAFGAAA